MPHSLIIIFINISLSLLASNPYSKAAGVNQLRFKFDKSLEKIENSITNQDENIVCIESNKSIKLIDNNIIKLRKSEPYYDWEEIQKVLSKNVSSYC